MGPGRTQERGAGGYVDGGEVDRRPEDPRPRLTPNAGQDDDGVNGGVERCHCQRESLHNPTPHRQKRPRQLLQASAEPCGGRTQPREEASVADASKYPLNARLAAKVNAHNTANPDARHATNDTLCTAGRGARQRTRMRFMNVHGNASAMVSPGQAWNRKPLKAAVITAPALVLPGTSYMVPRPVHLRAPTTAERAPARGRGGRPLRHQRYSTRWRGCARTDAVVRAATLRERTCTAALSSPTYSSRAVAGSLNQGLQATAHAAHRQIRSCARFPGPLPSGSRRKE